ncbi:translation initiation factor IF-2 [Triticum aestivum]|uniref:translation initiation factor IF-2 n=1 Tax=Triticum aestivum TaxID=4565 RepID=UPI001D01DF07|nr:translation initiation factor IF-2-like [Triticum aestivum]
MERRLLQPKIPAASRGQGLEQERRSCLLATLSMTLLAPPLVPEAEPPRARNPASPSLRVASPVIDATSAPRRRRAPFSTRSGRDGSGLRQIPASPAYLMRRQALSPASHASVCGDDDQRQAPRPASARVDRAKSHDRPHAPGLPHLRLLTASNELDPPAPAPGPPLLRPSGSPPSREAQSPKLASSADGPSPCFGFVLEL